MRRAGGEPGLSSRWQVRCDRHRKVQGDRGRCPDEQQAVGEEAQRRRPVSLLHCDRLSAGGRPGPAAAEDSHDGRRRGRHHLAARHGRLDQDPHVLPHRPPHQGQPPSHRHGHHLPPDAPERPRQVDAEHAVDAESGRAGGVCGLFDRRPEGCGSRRGEGLLRGRDVRQQSVEQEAGQRRRPVGPLRAVLQAPGRNVVGREGLCLGCAQRRHGVDQGHALLEHGFGLRTERRLPRRGHQQLPGHCDLLPAHRPVRLITGAEGSP
mmetsp:Transcript_62945/g.165071  ORF Transcript_62945/g.165071 Transcript_62945/m.165071 type:complete len:264 (-) Transcript_62945:1000-1791(-)